MDTSSFIFQNLKFKVHKYYVCMCLFVCFFLFLAYIYLLQIFEALNRTLEIEPFPKILVHVYW